MTDTNEITILEEGKVKITNLRAIVGTKTYAMSNVTSVSRSKRNASNAPIAWIVFGVLLTLLGVAFIQEQAWCPFVGLIVVVLGIVAARKEKITYAVKIGSASGETKVLVSEDEAYIKRIVGAINDAIIRRG